MFEDRLERLFKVIFPGKERTASKETGVVVNGSLPAPLCSNVPEVSPSLEGLQGGRWHCETVIAAV